MPTTFRALAMTLAAWLVFPACSVAGEIELPSEFSILLAAEPSAELEPGDRITFTLTAANQGPYPIDNLSFVSSPIFDQLDIESASVANCDGTIVMAVADLEDTFYFLYFWYAATLDSEPMAAGETRSCQLSLDYTQRAPPVFPVTFETTIFTDENPANNSATVTLRGAVAAPTPVPMLRQAGMAALLVLLAALGTMAARRSRKPGSM